MTQYMLKILTLLSKENLKTSILSIDREEIKNKLGEKVSKDKIQRSITYLVNEGLISEGIKNGKIKKYYIADKGLDFLEESYKVLKEKNNL